MPTTLKVPATLIGEITREVLERHKAAGVELLYAAGLAFAEDECDRLRAAGEQQGTVFARGAALLAEWGFGNARMPVSTGVPAEVALSESHARDFSPLPDGGAQCHVVRGILAGFAQRATGLPADVTETACTGAGAEDCIFAIHTSAVAKEDSWGW